MTFKDLQKTGSAFTTKPEAKKTIANTTTQTFGIGTRPDIKK